MAVFELVFAEGGNRHGDVLFLAPGIGKAEIDELGVVFLDHFHHVLRGCHKCSLLRKQVAGQAGDN